MEYTIVGKEVNVASRLENSAQPDQIHISHNTYELIKDEIHCDPVGEIKVKGLAYPIRTYGVIGRVGEPTEDRPAFNLEIDPSKLDAEEAEAAREALRRALGALEGDSAASTEE